MTRPLFDPSKIRGAPESSPARGEADHDHLTVSQLSERIKTALEHGIGSPIGVLGQVSNLATPNHWYFSLKDEQAVVSCVAWASSARRFGFVPSDGDEVVAIGHVSHYAPQGRTQFYVQRMQPVGAGALQVRFQELCEKLRAQGYFREDRKRALPAFPRRVAVITSAGGAAVHDVIATARHRCGAVGLTIVDVRVQGEGAAADVARAVRWVNRRRESLGVDAILVTRGGGSMEDLWAFNEQVVADAVFESDLPVVAAIGHESDTTVIELVADLRAATPTQAAMRLVPDAGELRRQIDHLRGRLTLLVRRRAEFSAHRLEALGRRECMRDPMKLVVRARQRVEALQVDLQRIVRSRLAEDRGRLERLAGRLAGMPTDRLVAARHQRLAVLADRLDRVVRARIDQRPRLRRLARQLHESSRRRLALARGRVEQMDRELTAVDPMRVLRRGYTCTTDASGALVRSVADVRAGDRLRTRVADGTIDSIASSSRPDPLPEPAAPRTSRPDPKPRDSERDDPADQMDLFSRPG